MNIQTSLSLNAIDQESTAQAKANNWRIIEIYRVGLGLCKNTINTNNRRTSIKKIIIEENGEEANEKDTQES